MAKFDSKTWNPNVFQKYMNKIPSTRENALIKNGLLDNKPNMTARLRDEVGGNYFTEPIKGLLDGQVLNYDGVQDVTFSSRDTFEQGKIIIGRMKGWEEKDFSTELTGVDWMAGLAAEVREYYEDVDQDDILAILKGIFATTDAGSAAAMAKHTSDISNEVNNELSAAALNSALQKAVGDKKKQFKIAFMHSLPATNLENLNLLEFLKYTDSNGIQRDLTLGTWNGKLVVVDDGMPVLEGYDEATSATAGAVKVVASGATTGQVNLADVKASDFYPEDVAANDYVVAGTKYVTYVLAEKFFEYDNVGVKVPNEMVRDAVTDGGVDRLVTRQRKLFAPKYFSFTKQSMETNSPTNAELASGANWEIVNNGKADAAKRYVSDKLIPVARLISRG